MSYRPARNRSSGASGMIVPEYKIALLGSLGVGKSALTVKFITRRFINEYDPTLEDTYSKEDLIDNQTMLVRLMDTAHGDTENLERYIQWADGLMVVYSITSKHSFNYAKNLLQEISELQKTRETHEAPVVLVGNKNEMERYRQVSKLDGSSLATQYACSYHEVSAAGEFQDVENVFHETVREIRREADRHVPLKPLFISEEKTILPSPPSSRKDRERAKSPQPKAPECCRREQSLVSNFSTKDSKYFEKTLSFVHTCLGIILLFIVYKFFSNCATMKMTSFVRSELFCWNVADSKIENKFDDILLGILSLTV